MQFPENEMSSRGKSDEFRNGFDTNSVEFEARKKFPYPPQDIVVEKRFGKRTAAGFCSFRAAKTGSTSRSKSNSINESEKSEMSASSALNLSCDSDHSDTLSFVSDLSELSMLSDVRFDHPRVPIAGVHGSSNVRVQIKKLNEQLALVRSENDEYQKQEALFVTGHRQELFQMKSRNFGLQRENTNLQSQLKSAQEMCESLRTTIEQVIIKTKMFLPF